MHNLSFLDYRYSRLLISGFTGSDGTDEDAERLTEITTILGDEPATGALSDEELAGLDVELLEIADRILDGTSTGIARNDTERLAEIAVAVEQVRGVATARVADAEAAQAEVDGIMARIRPVAEDPPEDDPIEETTETNEDEDDDEDEEVEVGKPVAVLTAAGRPTLPTLAELAARVPRPNRAARRQTGFTLARTEAPFIRALERRENVTWTDLAKLMAERWQDFTPSRSGGEEKVRLGRISVIDQYPEERRLHENDQFGNDLKMEAMSQFAMSPEAWTPEIVAAGGFCAPTPALYDLEQIAGAQRPLRDSLPSFQADRGGVRFTPPPDLADILVDQTGGAVGEWTNATDLNPGETVKTCQTISCNAVSEVLTKAIYQCLGFGNFGQRAYPEWVRSWTLNAAAAWARKAEQEILDSVSGNSTAVTSTGLYGFVSELLTHILQLSVGERSRQRMVPDARLRLWLPAWVPAQMQIDLLRQGNVVTEVRSMESIRAMFGAVNVNVTFYEDSRTGAGQVVGAQAAAELRDLPEVVEWYLFHEGAHTFLDGGELDLGLVRDSTLNQTNSFQIFVENWEETAFRGIFSYRVRSTLCPSGDRQIAIDGDPCGAS